MRSTISAAALIIILFAGFSCSPRGNRPGTLSPKPSNAPEMQASALTSPQDWIPPVFPGAVFDMQIYADMTAVASTPEAIDETACNCFGFTVHDAVFHAYRSNASAQDVMDFYSKQMAADGWKRIAVNPGQSVLRHQVWQQGTTGPLVVYLMIAPMEEGGTLIYLSVAESDSPQKILEGQ